MSHVTTHILDTALGRPATGVPVRLERRVVGDSETVPGHASWETVAQSSTNEDGRVPNFGPEQLDADTYRVVFDTADYFSRTGQQGFYPEATVAFHLTDENAHYHIPLLLSPFAFSTYRGS